MKNIYIFAIWMLLTPVHAYSQDVYNWSQCVEEAKENHPDLMSANENIKQSKADTTETMSGLFPQIDGNLRFTSSKNGSSDISDSHSFGASGSQLLFDGFKTVYQVHAARKNINASTYAYMTVSSDVRLRLRDAFVDLLKDQELLTITQQILKRRQDSLDLVKLRYEAGREHKGAVLTAEANLARAEADVKQTTRGLEADKRRLNKEMGHSQFLDIQVEGDFTVVETQPQAPDFEGMGESIPFLKELIARNEASKYGIKSAYADYFPQIFADGDIGRSGSEWPPREEGWSAGARVSLPLFDGASRRASVTRSKSVYRQSQAEERSGRDGVILTLHETWAALQDALDNVQVQQKFLESAETRAKISEAQYSNGLITFDDWIIIEDSMVNTRKAYLESRAAALNAEARWIQAKGGTLEYAY